DKGFTLTDVAFFNYVGKVYGGVKGTGSGAFDDVHVATGVPSIPGDANKDGLVDVQDFTILKHNLGQAGGWGLGNFNGDAIVDTQDFTILKAHLGEGGSAAVPEPATLGLLALAAARLLVRPRRRDLTD
ncbi:MAG: PEP-CTERM sorting domain-containing protein, partial [Planctomycetota bacterium]